MNSSKNHAKRFTHLLIACFISLILCEASFAVNCASIITNATGDGVGCDCNDAESTTITTNERDITSGERTGNYGILQCANTSDTVCNVDISITSVNTTSPQYFKSVTTDATDYFKCDWVSGTGFSNGEIYVPTPPVIPTPISASILHFSEPTETFATIYKKIPLNQ